MKVFTLNSGGSSIKFQLCEMPEYIVVASGSAERIGKTDAEFKIKTRDNSVKKKTLEIKNHKHAIELILNAIFEPEAGICHSLSEIGAVGHRVLHGGEKYRTSVVIDEDVMNSIRSFSDLAPLHNPHNLAGIEACRSLFPGVPQIAVFDNGFHTNLPEQAYLYALPYRYYEEYGIRKYGFHGIAFRSIADGITRLTGKSHEDFKVVSLMLGSGTTANAMLYGRSVEVSTGFTPHEGLIQSTRAGDLDAAVITYIMKKENRTPAEMEDIINKQSGWLGISGISNDLREIYKAAGEGSRRAEAAINATSHRMKKYVGAYASVMGGIDILVFAGGVGKNAWYIREKVCSGMEFMGLKLDKEKNRSHTGEGFISSPDSSVSILVVKADEEEIIAKDTFEIASAL